MFAPSACGRFVGSVRSWEVRNRDQCVRTARTVGPDDIDRCSRVSKLGAVQNERKTGGFGDWIDRSITDSVSDAYLIRKCSNPDRRWPQRLLQLKHAATAAPLEVVISM